MIQINNIRRQGHLNIQMIKIIRVLLLSLAAIAAIPPATADSWKKYSNPEDGFEVEFPGDVRVMPDHSAKNVSDRATGYGQEGDGYAFTVHAIHFTRNIPFEAAIRAFYSEFKCKTTTGQRAVKLGGITGSQIFGKGCLDSQDIEVRYFAKGAWFYQVLAVIDEGRDASRARRFFDSFRLTSP